MNNFAHGKMKKSMAGIMALMMLVVMLLSCTFVAAHTHHECSGHDCPVCACIHRCESMMRGFDDNTAGSANLFIPFLFVFTVIFAQVNPVADNTLISDKVRLNN